jgi:hypothetical protein
MYVCMYVCTYVCMLECICVNVCKCVHVENGGLLVCEFVLEWVYECACVCVYFFLGDWIGVGHLLRIDRQDVLADAEDIVLSAFEELAPMAELFVSSFVTLFELSHRYHS